MRAICTFAHLTPPTIPATLCPDKRRLSATFRKGADFIPRHKGGSMKTDFILFPCFLMRKARLWTALSLLAFATACRTDIPDFSPEKMKNDSFCAYDDISYFLGIVPEGPGSAFIVDSCSITYTSSEIIANVQSSINIYLEDGIPESNYFPEGYLFVRISDPGNRKIYVQLNESGKHEIPIVGKIKFPHKCEPEPDEVFK